MDRYQFLGCILRWLFFGPESSFSTLSLLSQLSLIVSRFSSADTGTESLVTAVQMLENLKPEGTAQSLLAAQMISTHFSALSNLCRAREEDVSLEQAESHTLRATRLMRLSVQQMELWAKLKGQTGQQKVVVEHVNVSHGGQAVIGAVSTGGGGGRDEK